MIIEGLLTTIDEQGRPHVAPMGPVVDAELQHWTLRPFASSTTFRLLRNNPHCVFHVVDDVVPVVESALGLPSSLTFEAHATQAASSTFDVAGSTEVGHLGSGDSAAATESAAATVWSIPSACHWYHLQVTDWDVSQERSRATARVVERRVLRPFWGWNRAKHAILEATILATRLHLADRGEIHEDLARLELAIDKTAGPREQIAWQLLRDFFAAHA